MHVQASQAILPPWLQRHVDRALSALPAEEKAGILPERLSIAVQVERDVDAAMELYAARFAGARSTFTKRTLLVSALSIWHLFAAKRRTISERSCRAVITYKRRHVHKTFLCWDEAVAMQIEDARAQGLTITMSEATVTSSPERPATSGPRVMGMSPPPLLYESPRQPVFDTTPDALRQITSERAASRPEGVRLEMTLGMQIDQILGQEEVFRESVVVDVAWALGASRDKIRIQRLQPGSIIITMLLEEGLRGEESALTVAYDLQDQIQDPSSKLKQGRFTATAISLSLLPSLSAQPILLETSPAMQHFSVPSHFPPDVSETVLLSAPARDGIYSASNVRDWDLPLCRLRRLMRHWIECVKRKWHIHRHMTFWVKRFDRRFLGGIYALVFRAWWQRKCDISFSIRQWKAKRAFRQMQARLDIWIRFLSLSRLERKADWLYVRRAGEGSC